MDSRNAQLAAILLVLPLVGCASLNDWHYETTQKHRALTAWNECGSTCQSCYPKDYRSGWIDGYYAGLTGDGCCPPAIAPQRYWDPDQIIENCDNRRHEYYSGWQDGSAAAARCPDTHYLKVWESCECPMPRCEKRCCPGNSCGCATCGSNCKDGCGDIPMASHQGMIEVLSDEPIGTAHAWTDGMMDDSTSEKGHSSGFDATDATDAETEIVPEAPEPAVDAEASIAPLPGGTTDSESGQPMEDFLTESAVQPVGFTTDATTPSELFQLFQSGEGRK